MTPLATFARDVMARKNENWADMTTTNSNHLHYSHDMSSTHSVILACSAATSPSSSSPPNSLEAFQSQLLAVTTSMQDVVKPASARDEIAEGPLCQFRKGFLDHLQPKQVVTSTIRTAIQQGTIILAGFMSEQLEGDLKRGELVAQGRLSKREAEEQAEEWEKVEWEKRWKTFPNKFLIALAKYHSITIVMRSYEFIASKFYPEATLDAVTMDFFAASKTLAKKTDIPHNRSHSFAVMAETTFWANLLYTLADYSVHQILFCYGYYMYYQRQKKRQLGGQTQQRQSSNTTIPAVDALAIETAQDCAFTSAHLMSSRMCGLAFSAIGAGVGTLVKPGWGTLMMSSMAESAGLTMVDDGYATAIAKLTGSSDNDKKKD